MLTLFVAASLAAALSRGSTGPAHDVAVGRPPIALQQLGDSSVAIFDDARAGRWFDASAEMEGIDTRLTELPTDLPYPDVVARMRARLRSLARGIAAHRTLAVLDDANALTRFVIQIADGFEVTVPFDIAILPYYGRQLKIGILGGRLTLLRRTTQDLRATWTRAEPRVIERGSTADARRFTDIVVDLEGARRVSDFTRLAKAELDVAASLNQEFESGG